MTPRRTLNWSVLCIFAFSPSIYAQGNVSNDFLWQMVDNQLITAVRHSDTTFDQRYVLQLAAMPAYANWSTPQTRYKLYMFANRVPQWSPKWYWEAGRRFDDSYGSFVDALDILTVTDSRKDQKLNALALDWQAAQKELNRIQKEVDIAWAAEHAKNPRKSKRVWLKDHDAELSPARARELQTFTKWNKELPSTARTVARWIRDYDAAFNNPTEIKLPDSAASSVDDTQDPSTWEVMETLSFKGADEDLVELKKTNDNATALNKFDSMWDINTKSETRTEEQKAFGGSLSFGGFINVYGGAHAGDHYLRNTAEAFKLAFQARAMTLVHIGPSESWYHRKLLDDYPCGPFKSDFKLNPNDFWKENGSLSLLPSALLVAMHPSVTVTMSKSDYQEFQQSIAGSAGFSIGPFSFGGGGSSVKKTVSQNSDSKSVTVDVSSDTPMVLAVLSTKINTGKVCPANR